MPVFYRLVQNHNEKSSANGKWYARARTIGTRTLKDVSEIIQRNCTVKKSDVNAVLTELPEVLRDMLQNGYRVKVDGLGAFKLGLSSKGVEKITDFNASTCIVSSRVIFQPELETDSATGARKKALCSGATFTDISRMANKEALEAEEAAKTPEVKP